MAEITITPANILLSQSAVVGTGIAGSVALARTAPIIYQDIDGLWKPAKADAAAPGYKAAAFLLCDQDSVGGPIHFCTFDPFFKPGFTIAAHEVVILSWTTAGRIRLIADYAGLPSTTGFLTLCLFGIGGNFAQLQFVNVNAPKP